MKQFLKFKCIYCGQHIECDPQFSGRQTKCPNPSCAHKLVIPGGPSEHADNWEAQVPEPDVTTPTRYLRTSRPEA